MKEIRDKYNVKIDIPKRDTLSVPNGDATAQSSRSPSPHAADGDEEEEQTIPITVTGPIPLVQEAIERIQAVINSKTSKTTQRVKEIPPHVLPFLLQEKDKLEAKIRVEQPDATLEVVVHEKTGELAVSGDRSAVGPLVESLREAKEDLADTLKHVTVSIPRNQHRFILTHEAAEEFMAEHQVFVTPAAEVGEGITIWGPGNLGPALNAILTVRRSFDMFQHAADRPKLEIVCL